MNEAITIKELYSLDKTIAADIFEGCTFPWEVLSKIGDFIVELGTGFQQTSILKEAKMYGFIKKQMYLTQLISQVQP